MSGRIRIRRVYEPRSPDDGVRVLVDRLWPRGLTRVEADLDYWLKDAAPSTGLRKWFGHRPDRWAAFRRHYLLELRASPAVAQLRALCRAGPVTLLYAARDPDHNEAQVLAALLARDGAATNHQQETDMNDVQIEGESYHMPPLEGFSVAHFLTVADIDRSASFYETVFGGQILSRGDSKGAPGYIRIANSWLIVNVGGGPTPDKPMVTLSAPADPDAVSSFMNIRVADIQACYALWRSRGAEFITAPIDKYGETRCYIRDPDGYIIEVGQSEAGFAYG